MRTLLALVLLSAGCIGLSKNAVREQASRDHNCPLEKVSVTSITPNPLSAELEVCGVHRSYRDITPVDSVGQSWLDVTNALKVSP